MNNLVRIGCALVMGALLGGCVSNTVNSQVMAFHALPPSVQGKTFAVVPLPKQRGNLEFADYAGYVAGKLQSKGLLQASADKADYHVLLDWSIDGGRDQVSGVAHGKYWSRVDTDTVYRRQFSMVLADAAKARAGKVEQVYQAVAKSEGSSGSFSAISRCIMDAVLNDFPGNTGASRSVEIRARDCER